ncbi:MAG: methylated-DNA--[protein]-cysteine S-methyltransferase [Pseudomonadales bacterium]|nr:methylated-DNA--[protein]-cysteine S-methyltransferase [Pseudomonadales bacterium]
MADSRQKIERHVWQIINAIPSGQVATYGQIAQLAGMPNQSRLVGRILSRLPQDTRLPWHRVVNSQGKITNPNAERQSQRLKQEGVLLVNNRVRLSSYLWRPG